MSNEKLEMRNEQRVMSKNNFTTNHHEPSRTREIGRVKVRGVRVVCGLFLFSLFTFLFSLFSFACDTPSASPTPSALTENIPPGKGSFSLSVAVAGSSRTILPVLDQSKFVLYKLDFEPLSPGDPVNVDRTPANLAEPIYLEPGTYNLEVTAFLAENKLVAKGSKAITINAGENTTEVIELSAIIKDDTEGEFTYAVTFPTGLSTAEMGIKRLNSTGTPDQTVYFSSDTTGTLTLNTGYYNVVVTLEKADGQRLEWYELVHIYASLESIFTKTFTDADFYKTMHTITLVYNDGAGDPKQTVVHGETISKPSPDPTKVGSKFEGWYLLGSSVEFDFTAPIVSDTIVYARWRIIALPLTDVNDIVPYFEGRAGGDSVDNPELLSFKLDLGTMTSGNSNWQRILGVLNTMSPPKYVNLDLTLCSIGGTGDTPGTETEFNPDYNVSTGKDKIVNITLPDAALSIRPGGAASTAAFLNFTALKSFDGTRLTTIGAYAFFGRTSLTQTSLPTGLTSILAYAFGSCTSLALESLPAGLTIISQGVFNACTNLALKELPSNLNSIGDGAFQNCTNLTLSSLAGVTSIGPTAFSGCTNLALSSLPAGLISIGNQAFVNCTKITLSSLPAGVTSIGIYTFSGCTSLTQFTLHANIASIGDGVFAGCTNLTLVTCLRPTPPTLGQSVYTIASNSDTLLTNLRIKVPADSLASYKTATNWVSYKERIFAGEGTTGDPFRIYDEGDLRRLVGQNIFSATWTLAAHYRMIADITLTGTNNWTPIGDNSTDDATTRFSGSFDGDGYSISGLSISGTDYQGMFGYINGTNTTNRAVVKNLALVGVSITSTAYVGGVAGYIHYAMVENCYVTGTVSGGTFIGGMVGYSDASTVQNCYSTGNVSGTGFNIGGVVGINNNASTVRNCYATGNVIGTSYSYSIGGVVGANSSSTVSYCVALNANITVPVTEPESGRVSGKLEGGTLTNNYARNDMQKDEKAFAWTNKGANAKDGADITSDDYKNQNWWRGTAFTNPAFDTAWEWHTTNNLPILKGFAEGSQNPTVTPHTTASIKITVDEITDLAPTITIQNNVTTISRSGAGGIPTSLSLSAPADLGSYTWKTNGVGANAGIVYTLSTTNSVEVMANDVRFNTIGGHTITLVVRIDNVPYSKIIEFWIVE